MGESRGWPFAPIAWLLFFGICLGLGYPGVHRYDVRRVPDTSDSRTYLQMVVQPLPYPAREDFNRILLPLLAKPVYAAVRGRVGSWDPAALALLVVNSAVMATSALLLTGLGARIASPAVGLIAALLLLVAYVTPNDLLSGLVDSGELCALLAVVAALFARRWWLLPIVVVVGAAAKETVVLSSAALVGGWLVATWHEPQRLARLAWSVAMFVAGFATATALLSWNRRKLFWPWNLASSMAVGPQSPANLLAGLGRAVFSHGVLFAFAWLLPLAIWRLRSLPRPWRAGSLVAAAAGLYICAMGDARSNTGRILYALIGPLLCLSAAMFVADHVQGAGVRR